jgi:hypothetical protein
LGDSVARKKIALAAHGLDARSRALGLVAILMWTVIKAKG